MSKLDILTHPVETLRTAPFGFSLMTLGIAMPVEEVITQNPGLGDFVATCGSSAPLVAAGGLFVARQFKLRRKIESKIEEGFDEDFFRRTTPEWCARQTVRTVLRKTMHLPAYEEICSEQKPTSNLTWLPHV